ncbi:MAG TPA: DNA replication and repair protein RecF [Flavobacteriales bacterium]|nr:DNA replication and repair protein RecF [Flavobacteriales bacterium]
MLLQDLHLHHFRNHSGSDLVFGKQVNCLLGDNGSGKTNVLDAVHYLCHTKSYFNPIDAQNITHDETHMLIKGSFFRHDQREEVSCGVERGVKKVFRRNEKAYERMADHIGRFPAVMIAPDDAALVHEGSDFRRKWLDSVISQFDRPYLQQVMDYNKALNQRNMLLRYFAENRTWDAVALEPWDAQLVPLAVAIRRRREVFLTKFMPVFQAVHQEITSGAERVGLSYVTAVDDEEVDFKQHLVNAQSDDRRLRRSTVGIHKDDVRFELAGHPLKRFGSQGQQKSFLIALRLAQRAHIQEATGVQPILLLDDIFDKIDEKRVQALMAHVTAVDFGQVFITDTDLGRIPELFAATGADVRVFEVKNGEAVVQESTTAPNLDT